MALALGPTKALEGAYQDRFVERDFMAGSSSSPSSSSVVVVGALSVGEAGGERGIVGIGSWVGGVFPGREREGRGWFEGGGGGRDGDKISVFFPVPFLSFWQNRHFAISPLPKVPNRSILLMEVASFPDVSGDCRCERKSGGGDRF